MNYQQYRREDFVADSYFRQWVNNPDAETRHFWANFLTEYPEQTETVRQAAEVVRRLTRVTDSLHEAPPPTEVEAIWQAIRQRVENPELEDDPEAGRTVPLYRRPFGTWIAAAASFVLLLGLGWWAWQTTRSPEGGAVYERLTAQSGVPLLEKSNATTKPLTVVLPDGSSVILQPGSRLSYPRAFDASHRDVYLTGEGFFEVAKKPDQPFFVYAQELVTKVLGTSFTVRALPSDGDVVVRVRTGRVSVFTQSDPDRTQKVTSRELDGVVLMPNQQVLFVREEVRLVKCLVQEPAVLATTAQAIPGFVFRETPISAVFSALEQAYGVELIYDEEALATCQLTADLTDEPLFEKLNILCKSIEARYEVLDAQIVISGKGCQP